MKGERVVAGLRCSEVIARLSDFVDGELPATDLARMKEHVAGCDVCERFGGGFAAVVAALRKAEPAELDPNVAERLMNALEKDA